MIIAVRFDHDADAPKRATSAGRTAAATDGLGTIWKALEAAKSVRMSMKSFMICVALILGPQAAS